MRHLAKPFTCPFVVQRGFLSSSADTYRSLRTSPCSTLRIRSRAWTGSSFTISVTRSFCSRRSQVLLQRVDGVSAQSVLKILTEVVSTCELDLHEMLRIEITGTLYTRCEHNANRLKSDLSTEEAPMVSGMSSTTPSIPRPGSSHYLPSSGHQSTQLQPTRCGQPTHVSLLVIDICWSWLGLIRATPCLVSRSTQTRMPLASLTLRLSRGKICTMLVLGLVSDRGL